VKVIPILFLLVPLLLLLLLPLLGSVTKTSLSKKSSNPREFENVGFHVTADIRMHGKPLETELLENEYKYERRTRGLQRTG